MAKSKTGRGASEESTVVPITSIQEKQFTDVCGIETVGLSGLTQTQKRAVMSFEDEIGDDMEGYSDAGELLTEELNDFLEEVGDFTKFDVEDVTNWIKNTCTPVQLSAYMTSKFSHGVLIGRFLEFQNIIVEIENGSDEEEI